LKLIFTDSSITNF